MILYAKIKINFEKNKKIINIISDGIGQMPSQVLYGRAIYKFKQQKPFIFEDKSIKSLQYSIDYMISDTNGNNIMIPINTNHKKSNYNIVLNDNDLFLTNVEKLINNTSCSLIIMKISGYITLYFQTQNENGDWQYTIADFSDKTIKNIPYKAIFNTSLNILMNMSDIKDICGEPLYIMPKNEYDHITTYIYSFSNSYNEYIDNNHKKNNKNNDNVEPNQLHEIYNNYYIIITFDNERVVNIDMKSNIRKEVL